MRRAPSAAGLLLVLLVSSVIATACAGERATLEEASAAREVEPETDTADSVDGVGVDPVEEIEPITLRLAVATDWSGDPADAGPASLVTRVLADLLHEGVTSIEVDGTIVPGLAERWFVTPDRLQWTFVFPDELADGLGEPLTARDIMHSLEAVAARGVADQAATSLTMISGWVAHMNGESGGVAGISAPDDTTLVIELDRPYELLLGVLASPAFGITGSTDSGVTRTTGAYRYGDDDATLVSVDPAAHVSAIELVRSDASGADLLAEGRVDWVVLRPGEGDDALPGDIVRQPLDLRIGVAVRLPDRDQRAALLSAIDPLAATAALSTLNALINPVASEDPEGLPSSVSVDVPAGVLASVAEALVVRLEELGVAVEAIVSDAGAFADRVASGEAQVFPVVIAGGSADGESTLRVSAPGGLDDVIGFESVERVEMVNAIGAELDADARGLLIDVLEASLLDEGLLLPIGQFEVRIGIGPDMDGLRHRADGTLVFGQLG